MRVAVTGGTGVVGTAVVRHLLAAGEDVVGLARSEATARRLDQAGARPVPGDVLDHDALVAAFDGCEVVFHVAGVNEMCSPDPAAMYRANVDGTRTVLRACAAAGVRRLVHTSSAVTIGEGTGVVATESTPHRGRYLSAYERSKHHAEMVVLAEKSPVEVVVVNPSSVQGPGRATGTAELIVGVVAGRLKFLVESTLSAVDIDDCARGHLLAAARGEPGERYLLSGFTVSIAEAVEMVAAELGRPVAVRYVPMWTARAGATAIGTLARLARRRPRFCTEMARVMAHGHRYDGSKATRQLGLEYTPPEDTIRRMLAWFETEGLL